MMGAIYILGFIGTFFYYLANFSNSYNKGTDGDGDIGSLLMSGLIAVPFALVWPLSLPYALLTKNDK